MFILYSDPDFVANKIPDGEKAIARIFPKGIVTNGTHPPNTGSILYKVEDDVIPIKTESIGFTAIPSI